MTGYVTDLSWKSGARAIEKLDRLRSTMAVNVLTSGFHDIVMRCVTYVIITLCWSSVDWREALQ